LMPKFVKVSKSALRTKTWKIGAFRAKYPEWWLVLIDHVCCGAPHTNPNGVTFKNWLDGKHDFEQGDCAEPE